MAANNMRDIKRRIKSVNSLEHITSAMKLVSAAKLRRAKTTFEKTQGYMCYILDTLKEIFYNTEEVPSQYVEGNREIKKTCYIVVTSNRGLCGGFNSNVTKEVLSQIKGQEGEAIIVPIGSKGKDFFKKRNYDIGTEFMAPPEEITFTATQLISRPILDMYDNGEIDKIVLVYTSFINAISQQVLARTLLPFSPDMIEEISAGCRIKEETKYRHEIEYEPSAEEVYSYLIPKFVEIMVYGAIVESATCEHAARRIAMENATDNANQMLGELTLTYNRTRQAAITREIIEIVSGAEALA